MKSAFERRKLFGYLSIVKLNHTKGFFKEKLFFIGQNGHKDITAIRLKRADLDQN